jgi:hypothetical protein
MMMPTLWEVRMNEVADSAEQRNGIRQGSSVSPCLFNIFIQDVIDYIGGGSAYIYIKGERDVCSRIFVCRQLSCPFMVYRKGMAKW